MTKSNNTTNITNNQTQGGTQMINANNNTTNSQTQGGRMMKQVLELTSILVEEAEFFNGECEIRLSYEEYFGRCTPDGFEDWYIILTVTEEGRVVEEYEKYDNFTETDYHISELPLFK